MRNLVRCLAVAVMVVLLPLRSWAGDVMATQMAGSAKVTVIAIEIGAASAHKTRPATSFHHQKQALGIVRAVPDCHQHPTSQQADLGDSDKANVAAEHCSTCIACQVCHTVALMFALPGVTIPFAPPQLRQSSSAIFTSAVAALGQKPPIV